jgi:predicted peptidase
MYKQEAERRWSLILYLHGGSLRGDDVNKLRTLGLPHRLEQDRQLPFVVVTPLCPDGEIWTDAEAIEQLLDQVIRENRIDEKRVYVTGHSMGGRGALYLAYKYPERFAAVVAISPLSPITAWAKQLWNVPLWIIHGAKDTAAPIEDSDELVRSIERSGGHPKFTRLPNRDHFILDLYEQNDVFDWMKEHSR